MRRVKHNSLDFNREGGRRDLLVLLDLLPPVLGREFDGEVCSIDVWANLGGRGGGG